jgi:hypothetical protein
MPRNVLGKDAHIPEYSRSQKKRDCRTEAEGLRQSWEKVYEAEAKELATGHHSE